MLHRYCLLLTVLCLSASVEAQTLDPETHEVILAPETATALHSSDALGSAPVAARGGGDLTLLKHIAEGETRGLAVVGDVLYRSNGGYFEALDVSDPEAPEVLSRVRVEQSVVQDVDIAGDLAYVVSARRTFTDGAGLYVVDISDPAAMTIVGQELGQTSFGIAVSGDYAYVGASTSGLSVYDVSDPAAPELVASRSVSGGAVLKVAVDGTMAYIPAGNSGFRTVDISDPTAPTLVGALSDIGFATNVASSNGVAYVTVNNVGLVAIDVTDPESPSQVDLFPVESSQVRGVLAQEDTVFVASEIGLSVLDVTDPTAISEIGFVEFDNTGSGQSVFRAGDLAYVGNRFDGVRVIDLTDLASPEQISLIQNGGFSFKVFLQGDYAYVSDLIGEYRIIDVSDPANAQIVGRADAFPNTSNSVVRDGIAYVVDRTGGKNTGLIRFDVSDPTAPAAIDTFVTGGQSFGIDLQDDIAYIANGFFSVLSVDIATPGSFSILDNYNPESNAFDIRVRDDVAYVATFGGGLVTLDISDPEEMVGLSAGDIGGFLTSVTLSGSRAYLSDGEAGIIVVDISDPAEPQGLGSRGPGTGASGVAYSQGFGYVAYDGYGLRQFDVTDPAFPVVVTEVVTADRMTDVAAQDGLVVAVDAGGGVYVFQARDNSVANEGEIASAALDLAPSYPNPFREATTVRYHVPGNEPVTLTVYNVLGQRVRTLVDGVRPAGWHEARLDAADLPSGVYFYRLTAGTQTLSRRATLAR